MRFIHWHCTAYCDVPETLVSLSDKDSPVMLSGSCNCATSPAGNMKNEVRRKKNKSRQKESAAGTSIHEIFSVLLWTLPVIFIGL